MTALLDGAGPRMYHELAEWWPLLSPPSHYLEEVDDLRRFLDVAMLAVNRAVNPECEHIAGDMGRLRLGRVFDAVLIHDAIMYAASEVDLRATLATAHAHCRPGGGLVVLPDHVYETFEPSTTTGGEDGSDGRGLRYLEWIWDPDPADTSYEVAYAFLLRETDGGLFRRPAWLAWLEAAGFAATAHDDSFGRTVFVGRRAE